MPIFESDDPFDMDMYMLGALPRRERDEAEQELLADRERQRQRDVELEQEIIGDPNQDYYDIYPPQAPKYQIAEYVAEQSIPVPLITNWDEWKTAFDEEKAMLRSEMPQDYKGFSGLLPSRVLNRDYVLGYGFGLLDNSSGDFKISLADKIFEALRTGEMDAITYMKLFAWKDSRILQEANQLGVQLPADIDLATATAWRYIPGTNIRIFRDPTVEDVYHIGLKGSHNSGQGLRINSRMNSERDSKVLPYNGRAEVDVAKVIDLYERVRQLPRFDQRQAPLLEIQMDDNSNLYFLQYLKTGHLLDPVEPFEIPVTPKAIQATDVRGATPPEGWNLKIYISPNKFNEHMRGQAFYLDWMDHGELAPQIMATWGRAVINNTYLSLKDNHFASAPFVRAPVALSVGLEDPHFQRLRDRAKGEEFRNLYIEARIVANGREGIIESDWVPCFENAR